MTPAERRALSAGRPREARALQRDRLSFERLIWPPLKVTQSDEVLTWWRDTLTYGGAWFAATWPTPRGSIAAVRKFIEQPSWQFVAGGFWRLSALCEVRGVGELPVRAVDARLIAWDPLQTDGGLELSNQNRTVAFTGGPASHRSIGERSHDAGKWYFEIVAGSVRGEIDIWAPALGLAELPFAYVSGSAPPSSSCVALSAWGRLQRIGGSPLATAYGSGAVIGVAADLDALKCWIAVDGVWLYSGNPAAGTNQSSLLDSGMSHAPLFWSQEHVTSATLRTLAADFTQAVPAGFSAWEPA